MPHKRDKLIESLCQGQQSCSQCGEMLIVITECIIVNECGHFIHEKCFKQLQNLKQFCCKVCKSRPHIVQIKRRGHYLIRERRLDLEQKVCSSYNKQIQKIKYLEIQLDSKTKEISSLKAKISSLTDSRAIDAEINDHLDEDMSQKREEQSKNNYSMSNSELGGGDKREESQKEILDQNNSQKSTLSSRGNHCDSNSTYSLIDFSQIKTFLNQSKYQSPLKSTLSHNTFISPRKQDNSLEKQKDSHLQTYPKFSLYQARRSLGKRNYQQVSPNFSYESPQKKQKRSSFSNLSHISPSGSSISGSSQQIGRESRCNFDTSTIISGETGKHSSATIFNNSSSSQEINNSIKDDIKDSAKWTTENKLNALSSAKQKLSFQQTKEEIIQSTQQEQQEDQLPPFPVCLPSTPPPPPKDLIRFQQKRQAQKLDLSREWIKLPKFLQNN